MADNDIYNNKYRYETFMDKLGSLVERPNGRTKQKYYCKNPLNLEYFRKLHKIFEAKDLSYIRRLRVFRVFSIVVYVSEKDLKECNRDDMDDIAVFSHTVNKSIKSKGDFIRDLKTIWKILFPEVDQLGRIDDTVMPYPVRHLSSKIDKSKEILRNDRFTLEEFEKLVNYFSNDARLQCYITLSFESLARPQELCYRKIKDIELEDTYARVWVRDHGKEGTKFLQCIDSFPYLLKWYEQHPYKGDKEAYFFISNGRSNNPLTPLNVNKKLRLACRNLRMDKKITNYSFKRNGITMSRLRGDSDVSIQHRAGWTSTKQLKVYDMSTKEDAFKVELAKRGLITEQKYENYLPKTKICVCGEVLGFAEKVCIKCKRLTDKEDIQKSTEAEEEIKRFIVLVKESMTKEQFGEIIGKISLQGELSRKD